MVRESKTSAPNVIIFGETGAGKSSIINMLPGGRHAPTSSSAKGTTFQHECYDKVIQGRCFNIFDTAGLNESGSGTVSAPKAIEGLYQLMRSVDRGINLLVYVMRPNLKGSIRKNYDMFYQIFCEKKVPIVLVITNLENEGDIDGWWIRNEETFTDQGLTFEGVACVVATSGRGNVFANEFEKSKEKIEELILIHCSKTAWSPPLGSNASWLVAVLAKACNLIFASVSFMPIVIAKSVYQVLWGHR